MARQKFTQKMGPFRRTDGHNEETYPPIRPYVGLEKIRS